MKFKKFWQPLVLCLLGIYSSCSDEKESVELSPENNILSFVLTKESFLKEFNISDNSIQGAVASDVELNGINLNITISKNATISPDPNTITSITEPFTFTVVAENGDEKIYNISIERELSTANSILEFQIHTEDFSTLANVDTEMGIISQRLPQAIDLTNLDVSITISNRAVMSPEIENITDFSSTVPLIVTSESGDQTVYSVNITSMDENFSQTCNEMNASKWFGGDNRIEAPDIEPYDRNVGTGQAIILNQDLDPNSFSIHLNEGFRYDKDNSPFDNAVNLRLNVRTIDGEVLMSTTTSVPADFNGGFIPFDISEQGLFLEGDTTYIFQWYLIDGAFIGVTASSTGNTEAGQGFCFNGGYSGQSKTSENSSLEQSGNWYEHPWNFNIALEGKQ